MILSSAKCAPGWALVVYKIKLVLDKGEKICYNILNPVTHLRRQNVTITKAQSRELKKVNTEGIVRVWRNERVFKVYKALQDKGLVQIAWSFPNCADFSIPGKDTQGLYY